MTRFSDESAVKKFKANTGNFSRDVPGKSPVDILEEVKAASLLVSPEDNEALVSLADSKASSFYMASAYVHFHKGKHYKALKYDARKEIKQIKKEIKAEKKAKAEQTNSTGFNSSNTVFTDRSDKFEDVVERKFDTKQREVRYHSLFVENREESGRSEAERFSRYDKPKTGEGVKDLFAENPNKKGGAEFNDSEKSLSDKKGEFLSESTTIDNKFERQKITRQELLEQRKAEKKEVQRSEKREVRKAAAAAAVSKMLETKKNLQNQIGDMSGQSSGDYMKEGSKGLLQTFTGLIKQLAGDFAMRIGAGIVKIAAPAVFFLIIPIIYVFLIIVIMQSVFGAVGGLLGGDSGEIYDLDVTSDGYVYISMSDDDVANIIIALYENGSDMNAAQETVLRYALGKVGCAYSQDYHGNLNVDIFDCSSLVYRAYLAAGIDISNAGIYSAAEECRGLINAGKTVSGDLMPGDLIFYGNSNNGSYMGIYHVAIYVGKVNGIDKMVEARGESYGVVYCDVRVGNVVSVNRPWN